MCDLVEILDHANVLEVTLDRVSGLGHRDHSVVESHKDIPPHFHDNGLLVSPVVSTIIRKQSI